MNYELIATLTPTVLVLVLVILQQVGVVKNLNAVKQAVADAQEVIDALLPDVRTAVDRLPKSRAKRAAQKPQEPQA